MSTHAEAVEAIKKAKDVIDHVPEEPVVEQKYPDAEKHLYISLVKSFLRIAAGVTLLLVGVEPGLTETWIKTCGGLLIAAEILGVAEELV